MDSNNIAQSSKIDEYSQLEDSAQYFSANQSFLSSTKFHSLLGNDAENYEFGNEPQSRIDSQLLSPISKSLPVIYSKIEMDTNQNHEESDDQNISKDDESESSGVRHVSGDSNKFSHQNSGVKNDSNIEESSDQCSTVELPSFSKNFSTIVLDTSDPYANEELLDLSNLPETIKVLHYKPKNQTIYLVGTSHFSKQSHKDVRQIIRTTKPAAVMLELCRNRIQFLTSKEEDILEQSKRLNLATMIDYMKKNGVVQSLIYAFLLNASASITKDLKMTPGGEFRAAFVEAKSLPKCKIFLGDRPIDITIRRTVASMSIWQRIGLGYDCLLSNWDSLSEKEIEEFKKKDALEQVIHTLTETYPGIAEVLIEERDQYLTHNLYQACLETGEGENIVGVVGIGHSSGIEKYWRDAPAISLMSAELIRIPEPKPTLTGKVIKFTIYGTIGLIVYRYAIPKSVKIFSSNVVAQAFNVLSRYF